MAYARFDANKNLEIDCEQGPRRKLHMFRFPKNMCKKIMNFLLILLIIILMIVLLFTATLIFRQANTTILRSENLQALQLISSGPNGSVNVGKTCGGVIDVNTTTTIQLMYNVYPSALPCTWIIQSAAEMVNLTWSNGRAHPIPNDELLVGELVDSELRHCRTIGQATETTIRTPAILQIQLPAVFPYLVYSEINLTPIAGAVTNKSQLATRKYGIEKPRGSLAIFNDVIVTALENYNGQYICNDKDKGGEDCKSVKAYKLNSTNPSSLCTAVPLLSDVSRQPSTLVVLAPAKGLYNSSSGRWKWEEA